MRMIISMKKINYRAPRNIRAPHAWIYTDAGGLAVFYDILAGNVYKILDEDGYFDEDY